jgi:hypothetical protein
MVLAGANRIFRAVGGGEGSFHWLGPNSVKRSAFGYSLVASMEFGKTVPVLRCKPTSPQ